MPELVHKTEERQTNLKADIDDIALTKEGISDFYWPINPAETTAFGRALIEALVSFFDRHKDQGSEIDLYKIVMKYIVAETCGLFLGDLLRVRLERDAMVLNVPDHWEKWPYLLHKKTPPPPKFLSMLYARKQQGSLYKKIFQPRRVLSLLKKMQFRPGAMELDGLKVAALTPDILANGIICTQRTPLITAHADQCDEDVIFCRSHRWFSEVNENDLAQAMAKRSDAVEDDLISTVRDLYAKWDVTFLPHDEAYMRAYVRDAVASIRVHMERLAKRDDLPRRLWTGSGGNIWDLMLRSVVFDRGGRVTGHDHGAGSGHVDMFVIGHIEFWKCHSFVTYNDVQVREISKAAKGWPVIDGHVPQVESVEGSRPVSILLNEKFSSPDAAVKKIFLLSTIYDRDRGRSMPLYPDLTYIDWQARLIGRLKEWGYDVYLKPHPESPVMPPAFFEKEFGVKIAQAPFEEIRGQADLFLFDYTYTSVIFPALQSNTPMMIIDFEGMNWYPEAYDLAQKRCSIIQGGYDDHNRIFVDWDDVRQGIKDAVMKCNNHEFVKTYFM
ncbi:MAG: hypothetical protein H6867_07445 [Rhodospirillales bacterium]|nr:hypothetical protein [Rhodospirillales bacterium]MCB9995386.1 hypothetical protein [Rhodospirillales bacterium]